MLQPTGFIFFSLSFLFFSESNSVTAQCLEFHGNFQTSALISQCTLDPNSTLQFVRCSIHCVVITTAATMVIFTIVIKKSLP